jgi:predicted esterase
MYTKHKRLPQIIGAGFQQGATLLLELVYGKRAILQRPLDGVFAHSGFLIDAQLAPKAPHLDTRLYWAQIIDDPVPVHSALADYKRLKVTSTIKFPL